MMNTGSRVKPFISCEQETREYYMGPVKYCTIIVTKTMDNIGDENRPYFVKVYEGLKVRVLGIRIRHREQNWKYSKL